MSTAARPEPGRRLRILAVDDDRVNLMVIEAMLMQMGHEPILADSGQVSLDSFHQRRPDLVLMDVMMPDMSGYDAVRAIRRFPNGNVPIIYLSALDRPEDIVEGLQAGGDDFVHKPIHYHLLKSKIALLHDRHWLYENQLRQNDILRAYAEHIEADLSTAIQFADNLSALERINDPAVKFLLRHAESFGGDLVAAARTPSNILHVMLSDSAGHGLTAALSIFPVVEPFYRMTAKGYDLAAVVFELNKRVRKYSALPRYVAAVLVSMDPLQNSVEVWNGGCPDAVLVTPGEGIARRFSSRHLPLGILAESDFDASVERHVHGRQPCQILLCSDGLTELDERDKIDFDLESFINDHRNEAIDFDLLAATIADKLSGQAITDDISLLCLDGWVPYEAPIAESAGTDVLAGDDTLDFKYSASTVSWKVAVTLTAAQLKHLDVVPTLLDITRTIHPSGADSLLFIVLSELFNNALDHGVLKLDSSLKQLDDDMTAYFDRRASTLAALEEGRIEISVERVNPKLGAWLIIRLRDSGDGFDYSRVETRRLSANQRHGRGLRLVASLCDKIEFHRNGSEVIAYLRDAGGTPAAT